MRFRPGVLVNHFGSCPRKETPFLSSRSYDRLGPEGIFDSGLVGFYIRYEAHTSLPQPCSNFKEDITRWL
jgi:hypothetical protein